MRSIPITAALLFCACHGAEESEVEGADSVTDSRVRDTGSQPHRPGTDTDTDKDKDTETAIPDSDGGWPPYETETAYRTSEPGYATGGAFADIDGDGRLDLVVANGNDMLPGPLMVHAGTPDGEISPAASWIGEAEAYHGHLATGDIDGDGWIDVAAAIFLGPGRFDEPGGVAVYLSDGGTLPPEPSWVSQERFFCFSVALGDADADGDLDLAAAAGEPYMHEPEPDRIFVNRNGTLEKTSSWKSADSAHSMDVAFFDADGDGAVDVAFARSGAPHAIYFSSSQTNLPDVAAAWTAEGEGFEGNTLDFGDVDADGSMDLFVSNNRQMGGSGAVFGYRGPSFEPFWRNEDGPDERSALSLVDLDGDGDLDLVSGSWWGAVRAYRNRGRGGGLEKTPSYVSDDTFVAEAFALADLDRSRVRTVEIESSSRLVPLPRPCYEVTSHEAGTAGDGYFYAGPQARAPFTVTCETSSAWDLAVTDWTVTDGNGLLFHL